MGLSPNYWDTSDPKKYFSSHPKIAALFDEPIFYGNFTEETTTESTEQETTVDQETTEEETATEKEATTEGGGTQFDAQRVEKFFATSQGATDALPTKCRRRRATQALQAGELQWRRRRRRVQR